MNIKALSNKELAKLIDASKEDMELKLADINATPLALGHRLKRNLLHSQYLIRESLHTSFVNEQKRREQIKAAQQEIKPEPQPESDEQPQLFLNL